MIALICDREPRLWRDALARWGPVRTFQDGVTLARYLQRDGPCSLAVVAALLVARWTRRGALRPS